jgi:hypothetical protein
MAVKDLCHKHGFSEASYYLWRHRWRIRYPRAAAWGKSMVAAAGCVVDGRRCRSGVGVSQQALDDFLACARNLPLSPAIRYGHAECLDCQIII